MRAREFIKRSRPQEDYDSRPTPPGPETKPTMPKGTVRVDVSDVYDWYKLGQHISDLKGLGKHDFGKGPPSAIISFGSEEEEHEYIKALQKTGLTTTDIDPVDPNQPKGMKRQKVDPTYNVEDTTDEGWKSKLGAAALAGAAAFSGAGAYAQASGEDFLPDIVAHVKFKVNEKEISKEINLGTTYKSPREAAEALEKFMKSKGIKYFDYTLERVKPKDDDYLDKTPYTKTDADSSGNYIDKQPAIGNKSKTDYISK